MFGAIINLINDERGYIHVINLPVDEIFNNIHTISMLKAHRHKHLEIWLLSWILRDIDLFERILTYRVNFSSLDEIIALNKYDMT